MTREDLFLNIKTNYSKYGITDEIIEQEIQSGEAHGFSYQTIYTGLKMAFGSAFNTEEYFTPEEVAEAMGVTVEEVIAEIEAARQQAIENGEDADEIAYKTEPQEQHRFIIPAGFLK
jgi:hypothetical protein